jgi:hypothetical protein
MEKILGATKDEIIAEFGEPLASDEEGFVNINGEEVIKEILRYDELTIQLTDGIVKHYSKSNFLNYLKNQNA